MQTAEAMFGGLAAAMLLVGAVFCAVGLRRARGVTRRMAVIVAGIGSGLVGTGLMLAAVAVVLLVLR